MPFLVAKTWQWSSYTLILLMFLARFGFDLCVAQAPMMESEKQALSSVLSGVLGDWWNEGQQSYPDPCGSTPIQGIECDQFNDLWHVTVLYIGDFYDNSPRCSSSARIDPALFSLAYLKKLTFDSCFTSASMVLPSHGWKNLTSLKSLIFRSNKALTGPVPKEFGDISGLESLVLLQTSVNGEIPQEIGFLKALKKLVVSHSNVSGTLPESIAMLENLLILDLSYNVLSGELNPRFERLKLLVKLDLSNNNITGEVPASFGALKNVALLDLRNNRLSGALPNTITEMSGLQELYLGNNSLGAQIFLDWDKLSNLASLDLSKCNIHGRIPESLGRMKALRYVALDGNKLSGSVPATLAELPALNVLYLNGNRLTGEVDFPEAFWRRLGRRLVLWDNPGLCFVGETGQSHGLKPCFQAETAKTREGKFVPSVASRLRYSLLALLSVLGTMLSVK